MTQIASSQEKKALKAAKVARERVLKAERLERERAAKAARANKQFQKKDEALDTVAEWTTAQAASRNGIHKALTAIRNGEIDENELNKLNNFCMIALMLMGGVSKEVWANARRNANMASFLKGPLYQIHDVIDTNAIQQQEQDAENETEQDEHASQEQTDLATVED